MSLLLTWTAQFFLFISTTGASIMEGKKCYCLNALANVDAAATSRWVLFIDQVLLLATITLTYISGVVPWEKSPFHTQTSVPPFDVVTENSSSSGSSVTNDDEVWLQFAWDVVRDKLMDSLSALNNGINPCENIGKLEQNPATQHQAYMLFLKALELYFSGYYFSGSNKRQAFCVLFLYICKQWKCEKGSFRFSSSHYPDTYGASGRPCE
ncbi:hypothetical protein AAHA92_18303 [Salvia divinorum]|uniref:Uncharacterized protein n=1 Tax=Salvia divinorum TaxID=28513 RepID=A0ABD1H2X8_SALDI